jgi:hypothetical protein
VDKGWHGDKYGVWWGTLEDTTTGIGNTGLIRVLFTARAETNMLSDDQVQPGMIRASAWTIQKKSTTARLLSRDRGDRREPPHYRNGEWTSITAFRVATGLLDIPSDPSRIGSSQLIQKPWKKQRVIFSRQDCVQDSYGTLRLLYISFCVPITIIRNVTRVPGGRMLPLLGLLEKPDHYYLNRIQKFCVHGDSRDVERGPRITYNLA